MRERIASLFAAESRKVLATLIRVLGDCDRAEEALQDAFRAALESWPRSGVPRNPRAWLVSAGKFRGIDALRREQRGAELIDGIGLARDRDRDRAAWAKDTALEDLGDDQVHDDQLRLVFTCCHPSLAVEARIALSLREVCGLSTAEVARAYLVSTEAMKRRISRAKAKICESRIPYQIPSRAELAGRLDALLHVIYLVYNEGFAASSGAEHVRATLTAEAVSLSRLVVELLPEPEALGLLALLLFHESRATTRVDAGGDRVPLEEQDRSRWDHTLTQEATERLRDVVMTGRMGPYAIQAAIASVHASAEDIAATNWSLIVGYYDLLLRVQPSPIVELQRAIAIGMGGELERGALAIERLIAVRLGSYHRAHAARAELRRRLGDHDEASASYRRAAELAEQEPERRYLLRRLAELS